MENYTIDHIEEVESAILERLSRELEDQHEKREQTIDELERLKSVMASVKKNFEKVQKLAFRRSSENFDKEVIENARNTLTNAVKLYNHKVALLKEIEDNINLLEEQVTEAVK